MLKVELNRIDGTVALSSLHPDNVRVSDDEAVINLLLSADDEIELYFPAPGGIVHPEYLEVARNILPHLAGMDNDVQRLCAEQCARSGLHSRNYEGELASITLTTPGEAVLHYFGTQVNTEWDERFVRTDGDQWVLAKPTE